MTQIQTDSTQNNDTDTKGLTEAVARAGGDYIVEHPGDPKQEPFPSIWDPAGVKTLQARTNARKAEFD